MITLSSVVNRYRIFNTLFCRGRVATRISGRNRPLGLLTAPISFIMRTYLPGWRSPLLFGRGARGLKDQNLPVCGGHPGPQAELPDQAGPIISSQIQVFRLKRPCRRPRNQLARPQRGHSGRFRGNGERQHPG